MINNIIDFHTHPLYDFHKDTHGVEIDNNRFKNDLLENGISCACGSVIYKATSNRPVTEYETLIPLLNDQALCIQKELVEFYVPGIHVHPAFPKLSCNEIERCYVKGVRLIGELVPYMMGWNRCADQSFIEIMEYAQELDMVVNIHPTSIPDMYEFSKALPKLKIVWAHLSGYGGFKEHLDIMKKYENVFFDISAHGTDCDGTLRYAIDKVGKDRLLYGSDYPGVGPISNKAAVLYENLSSSELEAIFYNNAKNLLSI